MTTPTLERIARALSRLEAPGTFSCIHREPAHGLGVDVDGVGRVELPLGEASAEALIAAATPSCFGYRDQTRHDTEVRDSLEIAGDRVHLDPRAWSRRFDRGLRDVAEALGFPPGVEVTARLHKLVIYREGHFFAPHRDTERDPNMRATLVVLLPSVYAGGAMVVTHGDRRVVHDTANERRDQITFLGLYADCLHEIRPVTSGHRVALTYGVHVDGAAAPPAIEGSFPDLQSALRAHFGAGPVEEGPTWLVYLLDHQYAAQSLDWAGLKNGDRVHADALRAVARELECAVYLALADVQEWYEFAEEGGRGGAGVPPGGYGRCLGRELTLHHWVDGDGRPCPGSGETADDSVVVSTGDPHQRAAYERSYEPWTGNEGGEAVQWYHQAALIVVPRGSERHREIDGGAGESAAGDEALRGSPTPPRVIVRSRRR